MKHTYSTFTHHYFSLSLSLIIHAFIIGALFLHILMQKTALQIGSEKKAAAAPVLMRNAARQQQEKKQIVPQQPVPLQAAPSEPISSPLQKQAPSTPLPVRPASPKIFEQPIQQIQSESPPQKRSASASWRTSTVRSARAQLREQAAIAHPADRYANNESHNHKESDKQLGARLQKGFKDDRLNRYIRSVMQAVADAFNQIAPTLHFDYDEHRKPYFTITLDRNGHLLDVTIRGPSHVEKFNQYIIKAVKQAQPFKTIPKTALEEGQENITIHVSGPRFIRKGTQQIVLYLEEWE